MPDQTPIVNNAIVSGAPLPAGEFWFAPPLTVPAGYCLKGAGMDKTILRPLFAGNPLLVASGMNSGVRSDISDLTLKGTAYDAGDIGLIVRGNGFRFRNIVITDCNVGVKLEWSVDNSFYDCSFRHNNCNIHGAGDGTGTIAITSTRFHDCQIREAIWAGLYIQQGWQIVLDNCVIESNGVVGMELYSTALTNPIGYASVCNIGLVNSWFENNPAGPIVAWNLDRTQQIPYTPFVNRFNTFVN